MVKAIITPEGISVTGHAPRQCDTEYNDCCVECSTLVQVLVREAILHAHADIEVISEAPGDFRAEFKHLTVSAVTIIAALVHGMEWVAESNPGSVEVDAGQWRIRHVF